MKLGLFGGSFDPFHRGHLEPVQAARRALGLDRVIYLPTAQPPHKLATGRPPRAPATARFTMAELALLHQEGLEVSDHELTLGVPAYTVETLEYFHARWPAARLHLLLGADSFLGLPTWRRWRELPGLARLVVLARPGWDLNAHAADLAPELAELATRGELDVITTVSVELSSTDIRRRLAAGEPLPPDALPALVLDYVRKYSFYR